MDMKCTETALIVLAAGQGSRMKSDLPKVLHKIAQAPLVVHALRGGQSLEPTRTVIVTGHRAEQVEESLRAHDPSLHFVRQNEQNGTAHAVDQARGALEGFEGDVVVLYGDTPFVSGETLLSMAQARRDGSDLVVLGFNAAEPGRYGRLITSGTTGRDLDRIVEAKDASEAELAVSLCNSGVIMCASDAMFRLIAQVSNDNAAREYYLTDIVALARAEGLKAEVVICDESETLGINTRHELAAAECAFQARKRQEALDNGVSLAQPETTYFAYDTVIGRDAVIGPNVVFGPDVSIESGAVINAFCHLEGCHVARGAQVGPFARLRPGSELAETARVGNFVEVKNSTLAEGAKVNHLSYVGDTHIGQGANVGAGTITCNYDGVMKHRTEIGAQAFIGSNTLLVAPVRIGARALTGSGTVVTKDVPEGALALARVAQENKPGVGEKIMQALRRKKMKKDA